MGSIRFELSQVKKVPNGGEGARGFPIWTESKVSPLFSLESCPKIMFDLHFFQDKQKRIKKCTFFTGLNLELGRFNAPQNNVLQFESYKSSQSYY